MNQIIFENLLRVDSGILLSDTQASAFAKLQGQDQGCIQILYSLKLVLHRVPSVRKIIPNMCTKVGPGLKGALQVEILSHDHIGFLL